MTVIIIFTIPVFIGFYSYYPHAKERVSDSMAAFTTPWLPKPLINRLAPTAEIVIIEPPFSRIRLDALTAHW